MEIVPRVGIGAVRLGMSRGEADRLLGRGMQVDSAGSPAVGKTYAKGDHLLAVFRFESTADGKEWVYCNSLNPDDPMRGGRIPASAVTVVSDRPDGAV